MGKFARIFETEVGQILVTLECPEDEHEADYLLLNFRGEDYRGLGPSSSHRYAPQEGTEAAFNSDELEAYATRVVKDMRSIIDNLLDGSDADDQDEEGDD